ncbi:MAG TPA: VIT1/CCC1 transporter family protein [Acidimicrobiales bacterium]|nr:VIT1/CCC1 transporter family protein [Acidimicrobiales bacterium]
MSEYDHGESHRQLTSGWFRAGVFGASDGLVTNISLILGFAGANPGHSVVRLAGLAGLVAGGFSMASGEWVSVRAQKESLEYEIEVERRSLEASPGEEREELKGLFVSRGIDAELADRLATDLMRDPDLALRTHAREELGVDPSATGSPWAAATSSFVAFCIGALIPLLPWLFTTSGSDAVWSIVLGAVASLIFGGAIGWFIRRGTVRWALRQLLVTTLAAAVTFGVGRLVGS